MILIDTDILIDVSRNIETAINRLAIERSLSYPPQKRSPS